MKHKLYVYRNYREGELPISEYIGKPDSEEVKELNEKIKKRKKLEQKLRDAKKSLKYVEKLLKI